MIATIIFGALAYCIGSLSSAIIVCKLLKLPNPRTEGSMNPGTTNVLRIGGKTPASITLACDIAKGFLPVFLAGIFGVNGFLLGIVALCAFLGHLFPVFFKFRGGKGVATSLGAIFALSLFVGIVAGAIWIVVASMFRYSSLAALASAAASPILMLFFAPAYFFPVVAMSLMLLWKHIDNIKRLRSGAESKIHF